MALYIDSKFASLIGVYLKNFKKKRDYLWQYTCPFCSDATSQKPKVRSYFYRKEGSLFSRCQHCGYGTTLSNFIKQVNPELRKEYLLETFKDIRETSGEVEPEFTKHEFVDDILDSLTPIRALPSEHPALKYIISRQIPRKYWNLFYYTDYFKAYTNLVLPGKFETIYNEHPRLIIPLFKPSGKVFAYQGRVLDDSEPKYYTIKLDDTDEKIFGLERVDYSQRIYVTEGPIDSLFLPNCIAVTGASFDIDTIRKIKVNATLIIDNEPRNKEIVKALGKYIDSGYNVFIPPDYYRSKDINDAILTGTTSTEILSMINSNTYSGLTAKLKFTEWKKST